MEPFIPLIFLAIIVTQLIMLVMLFAVVKILCTIEHIYARYKQLLLREEREQEYDALFTRFILGISSTKKNLPWFFGVFMTMFVCLLFLQGALSAAHISSAEQSGVQIKYLEALLMILFCAWLTWRIGYIQKKMWSVYWSSGVRYSYSFFLF